MSFKLDFLLNSAEKIADLLDKLAASLEFCRIRLNLAEQNGLVPASRSDRVSELTVNMIMDHSQEFLVEFESDWAIHQTRNGLYVKMQEEIAVLKAHIRGLEIQYDAAKKDLKSQGENFEAQLKSMMHACVAEEIVSEEFRKREEKALRTVHRLSGSFGP